MNAQTLKNKKITMATLKSFINKSEVLFVEVSSSFDGMTDCIQSTKDNTLYNVTKDNAIGHNGVYCVGGGRDYFTFKENEIYFGIEINNCCGYGTIWTKK